MTPRWKCKKIRRSKTMKLLRRILLFRSHKMSSWSRPRPAQSMPWTSKTLKERLLKKETLMTKFRMISPFLNYARIKISATITTNQLSNQCIKVVTSHMNLNSEIWIKEALLLQEIVILTLLSPSQCHLKATVRHPCQVMLRVLALINNLKKHITSLFNKKKTTKTLY